MKRVSWKEKNEEPVTIEKESEKSKKRKNGMETKKVKKKVKKRKL